MSLNRIFSEGDFVLLIPLFKEKKEIRYVFRLKKGCSFQCQHGVIKHDEIIGKVPGTIVKSHLGYKFVILQPLLPDIIRNYSNFSCATQIIYPRDWGLILAFGDIKPDEKIVEIGTGSGAFLAFLLNRIGESGWIYSYEKVKERVEIAKRNLEAINAPRRYTIKVKDVAATGIDEKNVDTVFIDIPDPWTVLKHVWDALKPGGKVIIYVPTYNQVEKTLRTLMKLGFVDINIIEGFIRKIQVKPYAVRPELRGYYFSAFIIFARKSLITPLWLILESKKEK